MSFTDFALEICTANMIRSFASIIGPSPLFNSFQFVNLSTDKQISIRKYPMEITGHHFGSSRREEKPRRQSKRPGRIHDHRVEPSCHGVRSQMPDLARSESKCDNCPRTPRSHYRVQRAKRWSVEVEENFRLQTLGWKDLEEYEARFGAPDRWDNGFIKCLRVKKNGYFTYRQSERECEDRFLSKVKLYYTR